MVLARRVVWNAWPGCARSARDVATVATVLTVRKSGLSTLLMHEMHISTAGERCSLLVKLYNVRTQQKPDFPCGSCVGCCFCVRGGFTNNTSGVKPGMVLA